MLDKKSVYIDTSVLIKRFVEEAYSSQVDTFFEKSFNYVLSDLVILEFDCALRRILRNGKITQEYRLKAEQTLAEQIDTKWFEKVAASSQTIKEAKKLIEKVSPLSLRSLDAIHLSIIRDHQITQLATADIEMLQAAEKLGITTHYFNKQIAQ